MSCDKTTGDCNCASPCAGGCAGCTEPAQPVLPRCQNVTLLPGAYPMATVVVNTDGCISSVTAGAAVVYTPEDCCGGGTAAGGAGGARGPAGPAGAAATIAIDPVVEVGGPAVVNTGTPSAAVLKFYIPASSGGGGGGTSGYTGELSGVEVVAGLVKAMPDSLVTDITLTTTGTHAAKVSVSVIPSVATEGLVDMTINVDALYTALTTAIANALTPVLSRLDALETAVTALQANLAALDTRVDGVETKLLTAGVFDVSLMNGQSYILNRGAPIVANLKPVGVVGFVGTVAVNGPNLTTLLPQGLDAQIELWYQNEVIGFYHSFANTP